MKSFVLVVKFSEMVVTILQRLGKSVGQLDRQHHCIENSACILIVICVRQKRMMNLPANHSVFDIFHNHDYQNGVMLLRK